MWVLGTTHRSSTRTINALKHWLSLKSPIFTLKAEIG